ncbi:MAG: ABC transporter ATP-binding protein [Armatimonadetes bacterium]|nr:ABC transporter ATP-binding protein [Armatimonadota bacterium]
MNLAMHGVSQTFGSVRALQEVDFVASSRAIHALVGENGAGKTTLMRILYGGLQPDSAEITIDGSPVHFRTSAEAIRAGIGMVSQHYSIISELTCLENLMLGAEPSWALNKAAAERRASELARQMGYSFEWKAPAADLSPAGKQKLEILKLLWRKAKIMILDEPTAMLSPGDSDALFASLKQLAEQGATVIVVTHRLPEVVEHCETVTVLRAGKLVASKAVRDTNLMELAELIVGHSVATSSYEALERRETLFRATGLTVKGYRGDDAVKAADLEIAEGEVVGLAGVDGNGQRELFQAIVGRAKVKAGSISFAGSDWTKRPPSERLADGLRLIPEDRHAEGVIDDWSLTENAALGLQRRHGFARGPLIDQKGRWAAAQHIADRFRTKHGGLNAPMKSLSGGNQQRFVAARALESETRFIIAFQPTRGLDIDGTALVYGAIREECRKGACALIVSFDLDELIEQCDRIVAICNGSVVQPGSGLERDRAAIGRLMVGAT